MDLYDTHNSDLTNNLQQIEKEIASIVESDKTSWVKLYELIDAVDKQKLWEPDFKSFSQWIKHLATECNVHESLLWKRKKAGSIYAKFVERKQARDEYAMPMQEIKVSPDNFELIEKIAQGNNNVTDELIEQVLQGALKRSDLKNAWKTVKEEKIANGENPFRANGYESFGQKKENEVVDNEAPAEPIEPIEPIEPTEPVEAATPENKIKAVDVVLAMTDNDWLQQLLPDDSEINREKMFYRTKRVNKNFAEFPVFTGTSRQSRQIDLLTVENITAENPSELLLHGVEIKVSKSDLENDHKMTEYGDFVDYLWFAVPTELVEVAEKISLDSIGIIAINDDKKVSVIRKGEKRKPLLKQEALQTLVIKII